MNSVCFVFVLCVFLSCSDTQKSIDEYANFPVKFSKQKVEHPNIDFSLDIPKSWKWKVEDFHNENFVLGISAVSEVKKGGFVDSISVQKIKYFGKSKDLKSEFEYFLDKDIKILESGRTKIFNENAFFYRTKFNDSYGDFEMITFFLESRTEGQFYNLTASFSGNIDLEKKMSILIQSLLTFKKLE